MSALIGTPDERVTYHVLRSSSAGVTVYMQSPLQKTQGSDGWPYSQPYAIAYETETEGGRQQRQVVAETASVEDLQAVLTLIESSVRRLKRDLLPQVLEHRRLDPRQLDLCSGFRTDAVRLEIAGRLEALCKGPLKSQAYTGFVNAVYSSLDDWVSQVRACGVEAVEVEQDAPIDCDWVQGMAAS